MVFTNWFKLCKWEFYLIKTKLYIEEDILLSNKNKIEYVSEIGFRKMSQTASLFLEKSAPY